MDNWKGWAIGSWLGWVYTPPTPVPSGGYITTPPVAIKYDDDDDLFLAAWMLFMRQPYRKE